MSNLVLIPLATVPNWLFWSVIIFFGGLVLLLFVIFPILIFIVALIETQRIPTYDIEPPERIRFNPALDATLNHGFTLIGHFTDGDKGISRGVMSFALSPDSLVLVRVVHNRMIRRTEIISRFPDKRWVITLNSISLSDVSGLEIPDSLTDAPFETLLQHHQLRLASLNQTSMPFLPQTVIADARQHARDRVEVMAKSGLARYTTPDRSKWKHTMKGATRLLTRFYGELPRFHSHAKRSMARRHELEWGLKKEPDQFLVSDLPPFSSHPTPVDLPPPTLLPQSSAISQTPSASPVHRESGEPDIPPPV
jgi:hypothetical protein